MHRDGEGIVLNERTGDPLKRSLNLELGLLERRPEGVRDLIMDRRLARVFAWGGSERPRDVEAVGARIVQPVELYEPLGGCTRPPADDGGWVSAREVAHDGARLEK